MIKPPAQKVPKPTGMTRRQFLAGLLAAPAALLGGQVRIPGPGGPQPSSSGITLVSHGSQGSTDYYGFTTSGGNIIDTTGANLLVVFAVWYTGSGASDVTITDNKGNGSFDGSLSAYTWGTDVRCRVYFKENPVVGSGHTFQVALTPWGAPTIYFAAFSGCKTSGVLDTGIENGNSVGLSTSIQPGSITPSVADSLVICGVGSGSSTAATISGMTLLDSNAHNSAGANNGGGLAYTVLPSGPINPTWNYTSNSLNATAIASFKAA